MDIASALIQAVHTRWPDVYDEEFCKWVTGKADAIADPALKAFSVREMLMHFAKVQCGKCETCNLSGNRFGGAVWSDGTVSADIFVIGEGPGQFEQRTLIPFVSTTELKSSRCLLECPNFIRCFPSETMANKAKLPNRGCDIPAANSGQRIMIPERNSRLKANMPEPFTVAKILTQLVGSWFWRDCWNRVREFQEKDPIVSRLYFSNIIKCRSCEDTPEKGLEDKAPLTSQVKSCRKWLDIQLELVQPKVVITLGSPAGQAICGKDFRITARSGDFYPVGLENALKLPKSVTHIGHAYHPSAISRAMDDASEKRAAAMTKDMEMVFAKAYIVSERT